MPLHETRPDPFFIADHRALDFLNSVASPHGEKIDWLDDGESFLNWLKTGFGASAGDALSKTQADDAARRGRALREWFRAFVEKHAGQPLTPSAVRALKPLNELLATDWNYQQVVAGIDALDVHSVRHPQAANPTLQPVAHAIAELLCHADFSSVRHCEGPGCTLWFLDVSKGHRRRWCSMAVCGNRTKVAQHRARKRNGP